jgi:CheY-like chemotaxis protein
MNQKILLIEDDQIFANIYRNKLLLDGFRVELASDGETGLEMVSSYRPDAVLLDLMLPKLPGVDIIKKLRGQPCFEKLPILVFTNTYLTSAVQDAWKAGATKCMAKADCTPKQVIGTLRSILASVPNGAAKAAPAEPAPVGPPPVHPASQADISSAADEAFTAELQKSFVESFPTTLVSLRSQLQALIKADKEAVRLQQLLLLCDRVRSITGNASIVGLSKMAQMGDALEALLRELHAKPGNINGSTLRTVASAIDILGILFEHRGLLASGAAQGANVLVVDDEAISRRALLYALEKAKLRAVSVEDPLQAFQLLSQGKFELIFLDVHMPNMNGFELCSKIRTLPAYKKTPVVFVTSLNDFENRANSSMSGGNDFIAKPFLFMELAVKALVQVVRGQLIPAKA